MPSAADQETASPALEPVREVFTAIVSTIVPEASALDSQGWINLEQLVEAALRDRPDALKRQLRLSLRGIQWMAVLRYGKPFTSLNAAQRVRFLSSLENHRLQIIRVGFWGLRTLALLGYYARPEAAREIGYEADARGWERPGIGTAEKQKL